MIICNDSEFSCSKVYLFMSSNRKCVENDNRSTETMLITRPKNVCANRGGSLFHSVTLHAAIL